MALTKIRGSILSEEIYRRENNLNDVLDTSIARNNLSIYSKHETLKKTDFVNFVFIWAGFENDVPQGFQLCNGIGTTSKGTPIPNLKNRFIIGAGNKYSVGSSGGNTQQTTSLDGGHTHTLTIGNATISIDQMPSHTHDVTNVISTTFSKQNWAYNEYKFGQGTRVSNATGGSQSHTHIGSIQNNEDHSHTVDITPPYYSFCLIIKL